MGKLLTFRRPEPGPVDTLNQSITISVGGDSFTLDLNATIRKNEPSAAAKKPGRLVELQQSKRKIQE